MSPADHGGVRDGAGRKPGSGAFGEPTQLIRVPLSQAGAVVAYLDTYRQPTVAVDPRPIALESHIRLTAFAHRVPAGFPSPAQDYLDDSVDLNAALIIPGHEASTFVLRVEGYSMIGAGIFPDDRVVVDRAEPVRRGDIVVAIVNNDLTIKTYGEIDGHVALIPENPHFKPIVFKDEESEQLVIWGVVTHGLRTFRGRR